MVNFIIFIAFAGLLFVVLSGGIGLYIASEKGRSKVTGFLIGACLPVLGYILLATMRTSDAVIAKEMYERQMVTLSEYKTIEMSLETKVEKAH